MSEDVKPEAKGFQEMIKDVETIIELVASEQTDLDQMVEQVEKGYGLIRSMQEKLEQTKMKIENLKPDGDKSSEKQK